VLRRRHTLEWREFLGFVGGALTTVGLIPQVWRLFRLRSAHEISLPFTAFFITGIGLWLSYGISMGLPSVIIWNAIAFALGWAMLYAKLRYGR
jgi:MtN3 and saliva related transmembrane protein